MIEEGHEFVVGHKTDKLAFGRALKYPGILENHFHSVFPPGSGVCQENTNHAG
jgi:hypothetical protein